MKTSALKAAREAKRHTSWGDPNPRYEEALTGFVEQLLQGDSAEPFLDDFGRLQKRVAYFGRFNSLSQTLLKITSPGVPDFYQGSELWNFNLVDPDNRRPVDFKAGRNLLAEIKRRMEHDRSALLRELFESSIDARSKLFVTHVALQFRRAHEELFREGGYVPLPIEGPQAEHACAFARTLGEEATVIVAPRLIVGLTRGAEVPPLSRVWEDSILRLPADLVWTSLKSMFTSEV
jgi:(1->4)-alpha-D-glucan 1-alpha-D-glucosylmutase